MYMKSREVLVRAAVVALIAGGGLGLLAVTTDSARAEPSATETRAKKTDGAADGGHRGERDKGPHTRSADAADAADERSETGEKATGVPHGAVAAAEAAAEELGGSAGHGYGFRFREGLSSGSSR